MSKNNKGYLLTETIIAITVVATIITVIYTTSMGNYRRQDIELNKANTSQDLYTAKELRKFLYNNETQFIEDMKVSEYGYKKLFDKKESDANSQDEITREEDFMNDLGNVLNIKYIYILNYNDMKRLIENELINTVIKNNLSKSTLGNENGCLYRYLIIYNDNSYSTIGIQCGNAEEGV